MAWGKAGSGDSPVLEWVRRLKANDDTLKSLFVMSFRKITDADFQQLCLAMHSNTKLKEFHCGHELKIEGVHQLADMIAVNQGLTLLSVGNRAFGDAGLEVLCRGLARNHTLQTLDLDNKGLGVVGCRALCQVLGRESVISDLKLARNTLGDEAVQALCQGASCGVRRLDLSQNDFGHGGAEALGHWLAEPQCTIQHLDLSANGNFGAEAGQALAQGLRQNQSVQSLGANGCPLRDSGLEALCAALKERKTSHPLTLSLQQCALGPESGSVLASLVGSGDVHVEQLLLADNNLSSQGFSAIAEALATNTRHRVLDVASNGIGADAIPSLQGAQCVQSLRLFGNKLGDDGCRALCSLTGLDNMEELDIGATGLTEEGIEHICARLNEGAFPSLTTLQAGGNKVEDTERWRAASTGVREGVKVVWGEGKQMSG